MADTSATHRELTEAEKRENVIRLAFENDPERLDAFIKLIKDFIPANRHTPSAFPSSVEDPKNL